MGVTIKIDPIGGLQTFVVNNATVHDDGTMSKEQVSQLAQLGSSVPAIGTTNVNLTDTVTKDILVVDMSKVPDGSSAFTLMYAVEATDGVNVQIQSGLLNANAARGSNGNYATSQTPTGSTNTVTSGGMTVTFSWATSGSKATLRVNANSSLTPTILHITFYVPYATHPSAISLAP